jgi:hypothetical protein
VLKLGIGGFRIRWCCRYRVMDHASHSSVAITDQLKMAGLVLGALESGRMPMHALDYLDIASAASCELALLDTAELEQASRWMPPALHGLVENVLFQRESVGHPAGERPKTGGKVAPR